MLTVVIPCAPHHESVLERALASVKAQTIPCQALVEVDHAGAGPGVIRNRLLRQVTTPYVTFLDADDWIEPDFAVTCLEAIRPGRYVYTDWYQDEEIVVAPEKAWCGGTWHVITGVLYTTHAQVVGGFNETLPALEDTEFWLKITTRRICGIHVKRPLMHYSKDGQRAKSARAQGLDQTIRSQLLNEFGGRMGCCGDYVEMQALPLGMQQEGDVLAQALWRGNHPEYGRATGRRYPRMAWPKMTWVDPRDVQARPDHWQIIDQQALGDTPRLDGLNGLAQALRQTGVLSNRANVAPPVDFNGVLDPDIETITRIATKKLTK